MPKQPPETHMIRVADLLYRAVKTEAKRRKLSVESCVMRLLEEALEPRSVKRGPVTLTAAGQELFPLA